MNATPQLLDVVALLTDIPARGLLRGQVGTVVELLDGAYEVDFSDDEGKAYGELALQSDQLLILQARVRDADQRGASRVALGGGRRREHGRADGSE